MDFDVDLFVIGGGSGGVRAARIAAAEGGARVALAEEYRMGGTCVIRGCVPKKLMVFASAFPDQIADADAYGWSQAELGAFDWGLFRAGLDLELARLERIYRSGLNSAGVTVHDCRAVVVDPHTVELADGQRVTAKHVLIATGGRPYVPDFPGANLVMTSNDIFQMESLPRRMLVIGGGFIACEFAGILHRLGVAVTQFYRGEQVLRGFDDEARDHIAAGIRERGIDLRTNADVARLDRVADGIRVTALDGSELVVDAVLCATGREPNTAGLGLEAAGVELNADGAVVVDRYSQTRVPSIYAVGDVTDRISLTPVAIREGHAFADTVFKGEIRAADHELVPVAVFTQPEFGTIGLTEAEAAAQEPVDIYVATFRPMQTLFAGRKEHALFKLVVAAGSGRVLGCHIVAPQAAEMIQLAAIAIKMGATKADFDRTVAVHPTMAEELVTMRHPVRRVGVA